MLRTVTARPHVGKDNQNFGDRTSDHGAKLELDALAITDPHKSVVVHVAALKANPLLPGGFLVSGLVDDVAKGRIEFVAPPLCRGLKIPFEPGMNLPSIEIDPRGLVQGLNPVALGPRPAADRVAGKRWSRCAHASFSFGCGAATTRRSRPTIKLPQSSAANCSAISVGSPSRSPEDRARVRISLRRRCSSGVHRVERPRDLGCVQPQRWPAGRPPRRSDRSLLEGVAPRNQQHAARLARSWTWGISSGIRRRLARSVIQATSISCLLPTSA